MGNSQYSKINRQKFVKCEYGFIYCKPLLITIDNKDYNIFIERFDHEFEIMDSLNTAISMACPDIKTSILNSKLKPSEKSYSDTRQYLQIYSTKKFTISGPLWNLCSFIEGYNNDLYIYKITKITYQDIKFPNRPNYIDKFTPGKLCITYPLTNKVSIDILEDGDKYQSWDKKLNLMINGWNPVDEFPDIQSIIDDMTKQTPFIVDIKILFMEV